MKLTVDKISAKIGKVKIFCRCSFPKSGLAVDILDPILFRKSILAQPKSWISQRNRHDSE